VKKLEPQMDTAAPVRMAPALAAARREPEAHDREKLEPQMNTTAFSNSQILKSSNRGARPQGPSFGCGAPRWILAVYKRVVSPLLPASCRFYPSCSDYAREAVERHGVRRGIWLAARRLLRCQPLCRGGLDPVP